MTRTYVIVRVYTKMKVMQRELLKLTLYNKPQA